MLRSQTNVAYLSFHWGTSPKVFPYILVSGKLPDLTKGSGIQSDSALGASLKTRTTSGCVDNLWPLISGNMITAVTVYLCTLLLLEASPYVFGVDVCMKYTYISVSDDESISADTSSCLNGTYACKTLEYALRNVTNCTYISINCSGPLTVNAPINVANAYGLTLEAGVTNQKVLCSNGAGLRFQAVRDVHIVGLYWYQCSIRHPTFSSYGGGEGSSGIVFIESMDISIKGSTFTSSYGTGLSLYNVGGTVIIQNCSFVNNTVTGCIGPICNESSHGLYIEFGFYENTWGVLSLQNSYARIMIMNSTFALNKNPYSDVPQPYLDYTKTVNGVLGGGLAIVFGVNSVDNTIEIMSCSFQNNSALFGAGLAIIMGNNATSNQVRISQSSQFSFNSATQVGGGIILVLSRSDGLPNNSVTVSASFISNSASMGGAMGCFSGYQLLPTQRNSLTITQSSFTTNIAHRGGSALSIITWTRANGGYPLAASMDQSNLTSNIISGLSSSSSTSSVVGLGTVYLESSSIVMSNTQFIQNIGTSLFLLSSAVTLHDNVEFAYNYAINGAAVYLSGVSWMKFTRGLQLLFKSNHALQYGGGVYQEFPLPGASGEGWNCIIQYENDSILMDNWNVTVSFVNNSAQRGGSSIYLSNPESCIREGDNPPFTNSLVYNFLGSNAAEQVSNPPNMIFVSQTSKTVWEGQSPRLSAYSVDHFNHSATSPVLLELDYNRSSPNLSLGGNRAFQLNSASPNGFYVTGPLYNDSGNSTYTAELIAHSAQQPLTVARIVFNVSQCPFGCPYNATLKVCQCKSNSAVQCEDNVCCIKYGYWYGKFQTSDGSTVYEEDVCPRGFCSYNGNGLCPENTKCPFISGYCKLPQAQNGICANNRGGAFCSYCTDGNSFTYAGIKCVDDSRCSSGYKTLLIFIIFLYWAILTGVILFALKFKFRVGSGRLYCVLYYFSIINYFVGNNYPTAFLQVSVDLITGIVLQPRFLGSIDLCLSKGMLPIEIVALNYIHPLFFLIFVFTIIFMAHYFRCIANLKSTSQAVCLLILLSHTSLVETSITILRPVIYPNLATEYVSIQPATDYLDRIDHLPYAVIALFVLLINIPLSVFLFCSPWLSKCGFLKMDKIKPILDEFQGCYKDEYRCFAGFYLIVRELIYLISLFPDLKVYGAIYTYQWVSIIAVIIHAMVQPYKEKWLNILDTVLLSNLVAVSLLFGGTAYTLFGQNDDSRNFHVFLVHIFVLMPIIYALMLGIHSLIIQIYKYIKKQRSVDLNGLQSTRPDVVNGDKELRKESSEVRLPLTRSSGNQSSEKQSSGKGSSGKESETSEKQMSGKDLPQESRTCIVIDRRDSVIFDTIMDQNSSN